MKIIAFYLPQFHSIPENDKWWGEGFTEWVNVKKAKPLFQGHYQPRIPLNSNYYNLLDNNVKEWQIKLAKEYGVYGFCFYHYWFEGHMLLQRPVEQFLENTDLDFPFCICWANEHWTQAWVSKESKVLIEQKYGGRDQWEKHFYYLLPYLKDSRYITNNGKPLFVIYRPELIECLNEMLDFWNELAKKNGFPGIDFAYQHIGFDKIKNKDDTRFSYNIEYQPMYAYNDLTKDKFKHLKCIKRYIFSIIERNFKVELGSVRLGKLRRISYDTLWKEILKHKPENNKCIPGAFVDWDNTARKGEKGSVYDEATPDKFYRYLSNQIKRTRNEYKKDMLFMFAWNEWAECGYLEPDEKYRYQYLEAIKKALIENNEFPKFSK